MRRVCASMLIVCAAAPALGQAAVSYRSYSLVRVTVSTPAQALALQQLDAVSLDCIPSDHSRRLVLSSDALQALDALGVAYTLVHPDFQALIDQERAANQTARLQRDASFFSAYRTPAELDGYLNTLAALRPDICTKIDLGRSLEGRHITGVRIQAPGTAGSTNPVLLIDAQQHAREWISPMAAMYAADTLVRGYGTDSAATTAINTATWCIVPCLNPDGYQYTIDTDRLWRKNRRPNVDGSFGVDLNRNWPVGWDAPEGGNSTHPGDDTYRGPGALSEPETLALKTYMDTLPNLKGFVDLHSYAEEVLAPWGYTINQPTRAEELRAETYDLLNAIRGAGGQPYTGGFTATALYVAAGTTHDYAFGALGVDAFAIELRDTGDFGFLLPPAQIVPTGVETLAGLEALAKDLSLRLTIEVQTPPRVTPSAPTQVGVKIVPFNQATVALPDTSLLWRIGGTGGFTSSQLAFLGATGYRGALPAAVCGQNVQFYVQARAGDGTVVRDPADAPASVHTATSSATSTILSDTFETAVPGWNVNPAGTDTATTGRWIRMAPQPTTYQPGADHTPGGTQCWVTDGNAGSSDAAFDVDGGATTLVSPTLDLSAAPEARIGYWRWFARSPGSTDTFLVDVTSSGAFVNVETIGGPDPCPDCSGGWRYHEFRVADFVPPNAGVRVRFTAQDLSPPQVVEAAVDDFSVFVAGACPSCDGDLNADHMVNSADLGEMLQHFGHAVPAGTGGDINADGVVNTLDLAALLHNFGKPCP